MICTLRLAVPAGARAEAGRVGLPPSGPVIQQGDALRYQVPEGWNQTIDRNTGVVTLMPRGLPFGRVSLVTVFSPERFSGPAEAFHDEIVRRATAYRPQLIITVQ